MELGELFGGVPCDLLEPAVPAEETSLPVEQVEHPREAGDDLVGEIPSPPGAPKLEQRHDVGTEHPQGLLLIRSESARDGIWVSQINAASAVVWSKAISGPVSSTP